MIEEHRGIFEEKKYSGMYETLFNLAKSNIVKAGLLWLEKKGSIEYLDLVGRFNLKQND